MSLLIIRFSERIGGDVVQQFAGSLHGALQRNSSGEVSTVNLDKREIVTGGGGNAFDVIMAYLKAKKLLNDVTVSYTDGIGKRETQEYPKVPRGKQPNAFAAILNKLTNRGQSKERVANQSKALNGMLKKLKKLGERMPISLPTNSDIQKTQQDLAITFHPDYVRFQCKISTISFGVIEPLIIGERTEHLNFRSAFADTRGLAGFPKDLFPICEDNGDYYCMKSDGKSPKVVYWSHNGRTNEEWADLATWIEEVWIGENEE